MMGATWCNHTTSHYVVQFRPTDHSRLATADTLCLQDTEKMVSFPLCWRKLKITNHQPGDCKFLNEGCQLPKNLGQLPSLSFCWPGNHCLQSQSGGSCRPLGLLSCRTHGLHSCLLFPSHTPKKGGLPSGPTQVVHFSFHLFAF